MLNAVQQENPRKRATVYLDDISILVSEMQTFLQMASFTSLFFLEWGITMNADKFAVVANPLAKACGDLQLPFRDDEDAPPALLGTMTGPFPKKSTMVNRCHRALQHLRRLQNLPLAQKLIMKIIQIYVVLLVYCCEVVKAPVELNLVDK